MTKNKIEVVIERIENLKCITQEQHKENNEYHRVSNGRLKRLEQWRTFILGACTVITSVVVPLMVYICLDTKEEMKEYHAQHVETAKIVSELINN